MSIPLDKEKNNGSDEIPMANREIKLDNETTRITEWRFPPGSETGWHRHTHNYVTVQQSGGRLRLENADGTIKHVDYVDGEVVAYAAPIEHNAMNVSNIEVRVLEIEYK